MMKLQYVLISVVLFGLACDGSSSVQDPDAGSKDSAAQSDGSTTPDTSVNDTDQDAKTNDVGDPDLIADATRDLTSDSEPDLGPPPAGCFDYRTFNDTDVSFAADVMPIFAAKCSGCHNDDTRSVYFGQGGTTPQEVQAVRDSLLTGVSVQLPSVKFVEPGDPILSYLLAKIEYDNPGGTCAAIVCNEPGCEIIAPPSGRLPANELGTIRSWVIRGAPDN